MSDMKIDEAVEIVRLAGGKVVGRTRFQKIAYLLSATGLDENFRFVYKHYGPFSEQLASAIKYGTLLGDLEEIHGHTNWGATYSIFTSKSKTDAAAGDARIQLASEMVDVDSVELELAATAVFLSKEDHDDPWAETKERKPEKATDDRIANAKALLAKLASIDVPTPLPANLYQ